MRKLIILAAFSTIFYSGLATSKTGNELLADCTADQNTFEGLAAYLLCSEYIAGVRDMYDHFVVLDMGKNLDLEMGFNQEGMTLAMICVPKNSSKAQAIDIIIAYLKNNPNDRHKHAYPFILGALVEAWRCDPIN